MRERQTGSRKTERQRVRCSVAEEEVEISGAKPRWKGRRATRTPACATCTCATLARYRPEREGVWGQALRRRGAKQIREWRSQDAEEKPQGYADFALRYMHMRYIRLSACRWMAERANFCRRLRGRGGACDSWLARRGGGRLAPSIFDGAYCGLPDPCPQTQIPLLPGGPLGRSPGRSCGQRRG